MSREVVELPIETYDAMLAALRVTAGNIRSLGPAGALGPTYEAYGPWLQVVEDAVTAVENALAEGED